MYVSCVHLCIVGEMAQLCKVDGIPCTCIQSTPDEAAEFSRLLGIGGVDDTAQEDEDSQTNIDKQRIQQSQGVKECIRMRSVTWRIPVTYLQCLVSLKRVS